MPKGGKRPGAGRPKGVTGRKPLPDGVRALVREKFQERVVKELQPLIDATMRSSIGATAMVVKSGGRWRRARNEVEVLSHLEDDTGYIIQTLDPDGRILNSIWDRVMGKADQPLSLPEGSNLASVEVTYKIVNKSADA